MKTFPLAIATLTVLVAALHTSAAFAQTDLAQSKNCVLCHTADKPLIGPSFKGVAAKYRGDKEAKDRLALKIVQGGVGVWGKTPMPANAQVSPEEAKSLAGWILGLK